MHIVQLPGVGNEVGIPLGAVTRHKILQGQREGGGVPTEGVHLSLHNGLVPADGNLEAVGLLVRIQGIDGDFAAVRKRDILPGQHNESREFLGR